MAALIVGYADRRSLSDLEKQAWPAMRRAAALRFWLLRLEAAHRPRQGDVVTVKEKAHKLVRESLESLAGNEVAGWIEFNPSELTVKIVAQPTSDQIPFDVNTNLIIELYR